MARKIKFALEMKDGAKVRNSLEELREHFDLEKAVGYFLSGKLTEWLEDRYYEDEAEALDAIDKDAPDLRARLCEALGVECADDEDLDVGALERLNEKKAILRQKTSDESIIANADKTALTQEDLADLLDMDEPVIYLCGDSFNIPARVKNKKYVGILGTPTISIKANSQEEVDAKGIAFENVQLPWGNKEEVANISKEENSEQAPASEWRIAKSYMNELFEATFDKKFEKPFVVAIDLGFFRDVDFAELKDERTKIALTLVCKNKYKESDLIHLRVSEDMTQGWALTKDSLCVLINNNTKIIPYESWPDCESEYQGEFQTKFYGYGCILKYLGQMANLFRTNE